MIIFLFEDSAHFILTNELGIFPEADLILMNVPALDTSSNGGGMFSSKLMYSIFSQCLICPT